ncbi:MAG: response regulator [Lachnospiraceae bacterium]|nr:response regulator [Lachnospiraceae bacterium]
MDIKKNLDAGNYNEYFDISPMACGVCRALKDETGSIYDYMLIYANPALMNTVGLMEGDTVGMFLRQNVRKSGENWLSYCAKTMEEQQLSYYLFRNLDGEYVLLQFSHMESDRMTVIFQVMDDIGGLEAVASKRPAHSEYYDEEETINLIPEGIAVFRIDDGFDTVLTYYNDAITEMTGYTRDEIDHSMVKRICYPVPSDVEKYIAASREAIRSGKPATMEYHSIRKNGEQIFIEVCFATKQAADGKMLLYGIYNDITALKNAELRLEESQKAYQVAIENDRISLWHYDIMTHTFFQDQTTAPELEEMITVQPDYPEIKIAVGDVREDSADRLRRLFERISNGEDAVADEIWIRSASDPEEFICTRFYISNLRDEFGEIIRTVGITRNITEEIQAKLDKQKYELAISNSSVSIWEFDLKAGRCRTDQKTAALFGLQEETEGMPEALLRCGMVPPESEEAYRNLYAQLQEGIPTVKTELLLRKEDGEENWQQCTYYTVCDDDGTPSYAVGCSMDSTAMKIMERHYQDELQLQKAGLNDALISKARVDVQTGEIETITYGESEERKSVIPSLDVLREVLQTFCEEEDLREEIRKVFCRDYLLSMYADGKKEISFDGRGMYRNDMVCWIKVLIRMHRNPDTGHVMAFVYAMDVTRERSTEDIFAHVVDQDYEFVGIVDGKSGKYKLFPKQNYKGPLPKPEGDDFVAAMLELERYISPESKARYREIMNYRFLFKCLDAVQFASTVFCCSYENGELHYLKIRASYTDAADKEFIITVTDVSDVVQGENESRIALEEALRNAMDANHIKSAVLGKLTHDVRTPVASLSGLILLLKEQTDKLVMTKEERARIEQYLHQLDATSRELLNSVNDVQTLDNLDKQARLSLQECNIRELLGELADNTARDAALKNVHFKAELSNIKARMVLCDQGKVRQMLSVLLFNAIKHTPAGKQVTLTAGEATYDGNQTIYTISIRDNGTGIEKELMPHIFELFSKEQTSGIRGYNGTGLELPVAKQLADLMQADLSADSLLGKGSTFTVVLPLENAADDVVEPGEKKEKTLSRDLFLDRRILLAEDNEMNAEVARMLLESKGFKVITVSNGEEAVREYSQREVGYFDAVVTDLRMPVMDGFEMTRKIRKSGRADSSFIPIIGMSADMYEEDLKDAKEAGMNTHLAKPIQPDHLFRTLAELMY